MRWPASITEFQSNGIFQKDPAELTSRREPPQAGLRQISITSYAAAGAVEINSRLAAGATLNVYTFELDSSFRRFDIDGFFGEPLLGRGIARSTRDRRGGVRRADVGAARMSEALVRRGTSFP